MEEKTTMTERKCGNCKFFEDHNYSNDNFDGLCKRYPPTIKRDLFTRPFHPFVEKGDWCGEHEFNQDIKNEMMNPIKKEEDE